MNAKKKYREEIELIHECPPGLCRQQEINTLYKLRVLEYQAKKA